MAEPLDPAHPVARRLRPGERVQAYIPVAATEIVVTDQRLAVSEEERLALDIEIAALRRIQFDIERDRPATLVIVPDHALDEPQVLAIPPDQLPAVAEALGVHRPATVSRRVTRLRLWPVGDAGALGGSYWTRSSDAGAKRPAGCGVWVGYATNRDPVGGHFVRGFVARPEGVGHARTTRGCGCL